MSWTKSKVNGRAVFTDSVTLHDGDPTPGSAYTPTIDFIPRGGGFTVHMNTGAVNTVGAVIADLYGSLDGTNWTLVDDSFAADMDTAVKSKVYVATTSGDWPYYRVGFYCVADESAKVISVSVVPNQ